MVCGGIFYGQNGFGSQPAIDAAVLSVAHRHAIAAVVSKLSPEISRMENFRRAVHIKRFARGHFVPLTAVASDNGNFRASRAESS